jgi:hypothetical protein
MALQSELGAELCRNDSHYASTCQTEARRNRPPPFTLLFQCLLNVP